MKFLFIVQGEGRGHLTQAITLEDMLIRNGHEVVEVLVGKSSSRTLPGFFNRSIKAPVKRFISPNFLPTPDNKRANLKKSFAYNLFRLPEYFNSMCYINQRIKDTEVDVVINFYELLTGLTYAFFRPSVPSVCIGHQYLFLHHDFEFPDKNQFQLWMLRFFTRMTAFRSSRKLALSFREMMQDETEQIIAVPPLLRREVTSIQPEEGDYIHGYMVNSGFADSVEAFHAEHPEVPLKFFWDKAEAEYQTQVDETLSFFQIDDIKFLNAMAGCRAYASTAGFESICEAMYLGKPVLMVPAHIEQDCNAYDAMKAGAGIIGDSFELNSLLHFAKDYVPNRDFSSWARSSERRIILELEKLATSQSTVPTFTNYLPI
ncbi:glycosyltransferase family protein [Bacteroides sp.]|uniref:glycosyltransferase family protein n=1 Tax=Bacteroides sp. TaxID=29523 RepID=UPI002610068B|nr:glycosyltransferase family protein [Bacteroides sp.]MDD3037516.1 glycosyltransferase family protein [Bacteroides sp.]